MGQTGPVNVRCPCLLHTEVRQVKALVEWDVGGARKLRPPGFVPTASLHAWTGATRHVVIPLTLSVLNTCCIISVFLSSKCRLFHNATLFGPCIIHILNTVCAKI
jgi:hypothetical protein